MKFLSVCSGIEAASVAWQPLGWKAWAFSEIAPYPCAVLAHHYPDTPNLGDMTRYQNWPHAAIDLLCGGTPCQSFSVAGLRKGLDDPRGNLMLTFGAIAGKYRPRWLVWENVPGVLSSNGGRDFGAFLGMLGELGYGFAYRVLDAQHFGVPQRRRRVFVVGHLGDWRAAAAVLFERHSLQGHPAPRREARQTAPTIPSRSTAGGGFGTDFDCDGGLLCVATGQGGAEVCADQAPTLSCNHEAPYIAHTIKARAEVQCVALSLRGRKGGYTAELSGGVATALRASQGGSDKSFAMTGTSVRRLTPRECERLQGFPDDYTLIPYRNKPAADGPRYKALGNSWAVPVVRWIGERIEAVDATEQRRAA